MFKKFISSMLVVFVISTAFSFSVSADNDEFAKVYKWEYSSNTLGVQATITLPTSKKMSGEYDFINYYLGLADFECGISTARKDSFNDGSGDYKWHWFVNSAKESDLSQPMQFADGDKIYLKLILVTEGKDKGKIKFFVNGDSESPVYTSTKTYTSNEIKNGFKNGRIVVACAQSSFKSEWGITQSKAEFRNLMYKDLKGSWKNMTQKNSSLISESWNPPAVKNKDTRKYTASIIKKDPLGFDIELK